DVLAPEAVQQGRVPVEVVFVPGLDVLVAPGLEALHGRDGVPVVLGDHREQRRCLLQAERYAPASGRVGGADRVTNTEQPSQARLSGVGGGQPAARHDLSNALRTRTG